MVRLAAVPSAGRPERPTEKRPENEEPGKRNNLVLCPGNYRNYARRASRANCPGMTEPDEDLL